MAKGKSRPASRPPRPKLIVDKEPQSPRRICIVVRDLYATDSFSDAGANALGLAQYLAGIGEIVTLLWVPTNTVSDKFDTPSRNAVVEHYAQNYLILLRLLVDVPELSPHLHCPEKASLAVYYYLKANQFDEVYCAIEGGLSYYTQMAMELGLCVPPWAFTLLVHTPTQWLQEADKTFPQTIRDVAVIHMEQYCIENANAAVFFSTYIKSWCAEAGFKPTRSPTVLPWFLPDEIRPAALSPSKPKHNPGAVEVGIWPGWEYQRGLTLLCDALDKAADKGAPDFTINCFGPFSRLLGDHTGGILVRRGRHWPFALKFFPQLSERASLEYLANKGGVALLPETHASGSRMLHACLEVAIPIIATKAGSNREMVAPSERSLLAGVTSAELGHRLADLNINPTRALKSNFTVSERRKSWESYRQEIIPTARSRNPMASSGSPRVSVVMTHYERPQMLAEALQSVNAQDYPHIEVVLVDDGSQREESIGFLTRLEPDFKKRGWKILRQKNKYLGAARNAGIRASTGVFILFLDDDNALLEGAISTFVKAMRTSGSDICTSVSKIFVGPRVPDNPADGQIEYVPLGGSMDFAFVHNTFGDANAMIRRSVFDQIGFLNEDYGFVASDWEFFTRAALNGLKVRIIPEATYWYRSTAQGMFRSAHWYDTRHRILQLFQEHKYRGLKHIYGLLVSQNIDNSERYSFSFRLRFDPANQPYERLNSMEPGSGEALQLLAEIAASEGRADTALTLLGQFRDSSLNWRASKAWAVQPASDIALANIPIAPAEFAIVDSETLRQFSIASTDISAKIPLAYVEPPDRLFIESSVGARVIATLPAGIPGGSLSLRLKACLAEETSGPTQILIAVLSPGANTLSATDLPLQDTKRLFLATSEWQLFKTPFLRRTIEIPFSEPTKTPCTLAIIVKDADGVSPSGPSLLMLEQISYLAYKGLGQPRRPRLGPPRQQGMQARLLTDSELKSAQLATHYIGEEHLLVIDENESGFALKPSRSGVVVAVLHWAFPAFARGVLATVEIANDDASSFEFGISLVRPSDLGKWTIDGPMNSVAFSGWHRVDRKFELHNVSVGLSQPHRYELSICAAIRLPAGSEPDPSDAYWRKFVIRW